MNVAGTTDGLCSDVEEVSDLSSDMLYVNACPFIVLKVMTSLGPCVCVNFFSPVSGGEIDDLMSQCNCFFLLLD